jgi:hypothetical protein
LTYLPELYHSAAIQAGKQAGKWVAGRKAGSQEGGKEKEGRKTGRKAEANAKGRNATDRQRYRKTDVQIYVYRQTLMKTY